MALQGSVLFLISMKNTWILHSKLPPHLWSSRKSADSSGTLTVKPSPSLPKLLITPIFPDFFQFFPFLPRTSSHVPRIPGVQTEKMGEKWGKMGKKWVKNGITGLQKTVLMHASAGPGRVWRASIRS